MATTPLFVADLATLKSKLRLSGVPSSATDTEAILNESILRSRLDFNRRLGETRVAELVAVNFNENPVTEDDILRALANTVEVKIVYLYLLRSLPNAFMDASGDMNKRWNEEAPFRESGTSDREQEIRRILNQVEEDMQILDKSEDLGAEDSIQTYDGTPTFTPPRIGDSLLKPRSSKLNED